MTLLKTLACVPLVLCASLGTAAAAGGSAVRLSDPWISDLGDGRYKNPVLFADYSDPDAIRVGEDYYLVSSSFSHVPGLPILHSRDLVNWTLITHALPTLVPEDHFSTPRPGQGVWAPALRHHAGKFWIYYPDPDFGLYVITAADVRGPWTKPVLVKGGKGLIDPCPFWDEDGTPYLIHGWAKSRAGISNQLTLARLTKDGTAFADDGKVIIDANQIPKWTTLEGPKLYKRNGYYYVFAPAGGVKTGWQAVFRSKSIEGPYEHRIVLDQGTTPINGPHQGAWVDTPSGEDWFLHFQDREAYGRIVHLQPMVWRDDWPVMGTDADGDGRGEPVLVHRKPSLSVQPPAAPMGSDEFDASAWNLAWQWQANPKSGWAEIRSGALRLACVPTPENLHRAPNLLLQKLPAAAFDVVTPLQLQSEIPGERAGLIVFGDSYAWMGVQNSGGTLKLCHVVRKDAVKDGPEKVVEHGAVDPTKPLWLRLRVRDDAKCEFSYSMDGVNFKVVLNGFEAVPARWVGAKFGLFAARPETPAAQPEVATRKGVAITDWIRVTAP